MRGASGGGLFRKWLEPFHKLRVFVLYGDKLRVEKVVYTRFLSFFLYTCFLYVVIFLVRKRDDGSCLGIVINFILLENCLGDKIIALPDGVFMGPALKLFKYGGNLFFL